MVVITSLWNGTFETALPGLLLLLSSLLFLPGALASGRKLAGGAPEPLLTWRPVWLAFWIFPAVFIVGSLVAQGPAVLSTWLISPFYFLGMLIPQLWLISLGARGLTTLTRGQAWKIWGISLGITPFLILLVELVLGALAVFGVGLLLSNEPGFMADIQRLWSQVQAGMQFSTLELLDFAEKYLVRLDVVLVAGVFAAVVVPLLEELLKPLAVYLLAGRSLSPSAGFVGGMIAGAAFGFFETLGLSTDSQSFASVIGVRLGTSLLHIVTAGLTGYGLGLALQNRQPGALLKNFTFAVLLHGLWNGVTVLAVLGQLPGGTALVNPTIATAISGITIVALIFVSLVILRVINRKLQVPQPQDALPA